MALAYPKNRVLVPNILTDCAHSLEKGGKQEPAVGGRLPMVKSFPASALEKTDLAIFYISGQQNTWWATGSNCGRLLFVY